MRNRIRDIPLLCVYPKNAYDLNHMVFLKQLFDVGTLDFL